MTTAYQKELKKFDEERALLAWDGLISKQQTALAALGIPTMFNTGIKADREVSASWLSDLRNIDSLSTAPTKSYASRGGHRW